MSTYLWIWITIIPVWNVSLSCCGYFWVCFHFLWLPPSRESVTRLRPVVITSELDRFSITIHLRRIWIQRYYLLPRYKCRPNFFVCPFNPTICVLPFWSLALWYSPWECVWILLNKTNDFVINLNFILINFGVYIKKLNYETFNNVFFVCFVYQLIKRQHNNLVLVIYNNKFNIFHKKTKEYFLKNKR